MTLQSRDDRAVRACVINHTHWDREWFLTSVYTSRWIPGLIDRLEALAEENPSFHYFLDGQTLVIEDLLTLDPGYKEKVVRLVREGILQIGPYYCQPDWRLAGGEALLRNLLWGGQDVSNLIQTGLGERQTLESRVEPGWLVDTFGHISQTPQIHRLFGISQVYVWRGIPELWPYFLWEGADGSSLFAINLFGGYRNLYGLTLRPEIAARRLETEVKKLRPFYPTPDIPLFDGYDLEDNPEDPVRFLQSCDLPAGLEVNETTPGDFALEMAARLREEGRKLPNLQGELISGKYAAVFPGTLTSRIYLKIMANDTEQMLYKLGEPLGTLAWLCGRPYPEGEYEAWGRALLQNAVHDCLCGVSIDQVHEKMEVLYRRVFEALLKDIQESLDWILREFASGEYAVSTNPFALDQWQVVGEELMHVVTEGIGIWPVKERLPVEMVGEIRSGLHWKNEHYKAYLSSDGRVQVGPARLGELVISREEGDTYSEEAGERLGTLVPSGPLTLLEKSTGHMRAGFTCEWRGKEEWVRAEVQLTFNSSPLIDWEITLETHGAGLRVDLLVEPGIDGELYAGMPFDFVQRQGRDSDLLPRELPENLSGVLLGQRELGSTATFPFQELLAVIGGGRTVCVFVRGLRAYRVGEMGTLELPLTRTVERLTRPDLKNRVGDAGPFFYVPGARSERKVTHRLAVAAGDNPIDSMQLQALNAGFQNPPLIVQGQGSGKRSEWQVFHEGLPLSSLSVREGVALARLYNPTPKAQPLSRAYPQTDVWGKGLGLIESVRPKGIVTLQLESINEVHPESGKEKEMSQTRLLSGPEWRVGADQARPDPNVVNEMEWMAARLKEEIGKLEEKLAGVEGGERLKLEHRAYSLKRECAEVELSILLNRRKLEAQGEVNEERLFRVDEEIAALGLQLNRLRIQRRIFDYIIQAI